MTFIIPVGRPLYEGLVAPKPQAQAQAAPAVGAEAAQNRTQDQVNLSPEAQAYLQSQKPAPIADDAVQAPAQRLLDKTV